jgi:hypothetical protein
VYVQLLVRRVGLLSSGVYQFREGNELDTSRLRTTLTALAVGAAVALSASCAQAVTWNLLPTPNTSPGNSLTVSSGGISITADGFTNISALIAGVPPNSALFEKSQGAGEIGLGLTNDPAGCPSSCQNEISGTNLIRINFTDAINHGIVSFTFVMDSTTAGEAWAVFGSNLATNDFHQITIAGNGVNDESSHTLTGANLFDYYLFSINPFLVEPAGANVLLGSPISGAVPEPSTWAMMLIGFAGLGFAFRRSRRRVSFA